MDLILIVDKNRLWADDDGPDQQKPVRAQLFHQTIEKEMAMTMVAQLHFCAMATIDQRI